jgi:hypothetical protein
LSLLAVLIAGGELVRAIIVGAFDEAQPPCPALGLALGTRSKVRAFLGACLEASSGRQLLFESAPPGGGHVEAGGFLRVYLVELVLHVSGERIVDE